MQRNKIQLYANQVYVTDEVKEIVPEFLTLLHGVIDSPDIPLNVSRSYLQSDQNVKKITGYITRKVAEKLHDLFKNDRDAFAEKWDDLSVFVKYGMVSDEKFYERATKFVLLKTTEGKYFTLEEYRDKVKSLQTDKHDRQVYIYTHDEAAHHAIVTAAKDRGYDVLVCDNIIDNHFMQQLEMKEDKLTFVRVDSDTLDNLVQKDDKPESVLSEEQTKEVKDAFEAVIKQQGRVETKALSPEDLPVQITRPEFLRRMQEMQALQGNRMDDFPMSYNVVVNTNHPLVSGKLLAASAESREELANYLYQVALLSQNLLKGEALTNFVRQSLKMAE
jgi:molecular chaperone HtpG